MDEHRMGTGTGAGTETRRDRNRNEDKIGEGGREAKKRKKPHKSCRRHVGNGRDLGGKRKKARQERAGSVAAKPNKLEIMKEAGGRP